MKIIYQNIEKLREKLAEQTIDEVAVLSYSRAIIAGIYQHINLQSKQHIMKKLKDDRKISQILFYKNCISGENHIEDERTNSIRTILHYLFAFYEIVRVYEDLSIDISFLKQDTNNIKWKKIKRTWKVKYEAYIVKKTFDHTYKMFAYEVAPNKMKVGTSIHPTDKATRWTVYSQDDNLSLDSSYYISANIHKLILNGEQNIYINILDNNDMMTPAPNEIDPDFLDMMNIIIKKTQTNPLEYITMLHELKDYNVLDTEEKEIYNNFINMLKEKYWDIRKVDNHFASLDFIYKNLVAFKHYHLSVRIKIFSKSFSPLTNEFWTKSNQGKSFKFHELKIIKEILVKNRIGFEDNFKFYENRIFDMKLYEHNELYFPITNKKIIIDFPDNNDFYGEHNEYKVVSFAKKNNEKYLTLNSILDVIKTFSSLPFSEKIVNEFEYDTNIWKEFELDNKQNSIIEKIIENRISIIMGKAGTGKSTVATSFIKVFYDLNEQSIFIAPTLKAAGVVSELSDGVKDEFEFGKIPNKTIESFIKFYEHKIENEIPFETYDNIIIDEITMVSLSDWRRLLELLEYLGFKRIIMIGDPNQLEPVNSVAMSKYIFDKKSGTHKILELSAPKRNINSENLYNNIIEKIRIEELVIGCEDSFKAFGDIEGYLGILKKIKDSNEEWKILTPLNGGIFGRDSINSYVLDSDPSEGFKEKDVIAVTSSSKDWKLRPYIFNGNEFKIEEKIGNKYRTNIITKNANETFNDVGWYSDETGYLWWDGDNIDDDDYPLALAKCMTIHKAQGSTFDNVVVIIPKGYILDRKSLYTAVSRAKKKLRIVIDISEKDKYQVSKK